MDECFPMNTRRPARPRARLRHVYWIGGASGAGKSTVARRIAAAHGLYLLFEQTRRLDLPAIEIDTATNEDELARRVTQAFGL